MFDNGKRDDQARCMTYDARFAIRLPLTARVRLDEVAGNRGASASAVGRAAIEAFLASNEKDTPPVGASGASGQSDGTALRGPA